MSRIENLFSHEGRLILGLAVSEAESWRHKHEEDRELEPTMDMRGGKGI